jgi:pyruvate carboxylase
VQPFYDSLLTKVTARASSFDGAVHKLTRALREHRIRGVTTNISCVGAAVAGADGRR